MEKVKCAIVPLDTFTYENFRSFCQIHKRGRVRKEIKFLSLKSDSKCKKRQWLSTGRSWILEQPRNFDDLLSN